MTSVVADAHLRAVGLPNAAVLRQVSADDHLARLQLQGVGRTSAADVLAYPPTIVRDLVPVGSIPFAVERSPRDGRVLVAVDALVGEEDALVALQHHLYGHTVALAGIVAGALLASPRESVVGRAGAYNLLIEFALSPPFCLARYEQLQFAPGQLYDLWFPASSAQHGDRVAPRLSAVAGYHDEHLAVVVGLGVGVGRPCEEHPSVLQAHHIGIGVSVPSMREPRLVVVDELLGLRPRAPVVGGALQVDVLPVVGIGGRSVASVIGEQKRVGTYSQHARIFCLDVVGVELYGRRQGLPADAMLWRCDGGVDGIGAVVGHGAHLALDALQLSADVGFGREGVGGGRLKIGEHLRLEDVVAHLVGALYAILCDGPVFRAPFQALGRADDLSRPIDGFAATCLQVETHAVLLSGQEVGTDGFERSVVQRCSYLGALHAGIVARKSAQIVAETIGSHLAERQRQVGNLEGCLVGLRLDEVDGEADGLEDVRLYEGVATIVAADDDAQVVVVDGCLLVGGLIGAADVLPCCPLVGRLLPLNVAAVVGSPAQT